MKIKNLVLSGTLLFAISSFAQKEEIKKLSAIYAKVSKTTADLTDYETNLTRLNAMSSTDLDIAYADFFKLIPTIQNLKALGQSPNKADVAALLNPKMIKKLVSSINIIVDGEKALSKKSLTDQLLIDLPSIKNYIFNYAVNLGDEKKYKESSEVLYNVYELDKKDNDKLYYAASYALNGQDMDKALLYYNELKAKKYSGEATYYYATSKASDKEEYFEANKKVRDDYVKLGTHTKPREEKIPSKRGEIFKNIALILTQKGRAKDAIIAISEARNENPDDISLVLTEADLYYKQGDMETYKILVNRALEKNPNDADLIFNLGVVNGAANNNAEAEKHYKRAIELKPDYTNAYINLSELILRADKGFFEKMNKLGTSDKDTKTYNALKIEREANYKKAMPYLEKAVELEPNNEAAKATLLSIYKGLEMSAKVKELKAKM